MKVLQSILILFSIALFGCDGFLGTKTDLDFIDVPNYLGRDVAYVPIQPIIEGFLEPTDVIVGYDELVYVVDKGSEEIIGFDVAGREIGRFSLPGVTKITQDRRMNILALATFDTSINDQVYNLSAIYRLSLSGELGYGIQYASIVKKVVNPFYFKSSFSSDDALVKFSSIDVLADNRYFVTRTGPRDNEIQVGGPDDGVLLFDIDDDYVSNVFVSAESGLSRGYFRTPTCIVTAAKPPQSPSVSESQNFFVAMADKQVPIKVQSVRFTETDFGSSYNAEFLDYSDTSAADDFLYRPDRFSNPVDLWLTGDGTNYLFVVDEDRDSLFQFTTNGLEGINPPAGSSATKNIIASFGGRGQGPMEFNHPSAVAYFDQIVYVTDKQNGRLLRFKLTTDFD